MKPITIKMTGKLALMTLMFATTFGSPAVQASVKEVNELHGRVARKISELKNQNVFSKEYKVFSVEQNSIAESLRETVTKFTLLNLKDDAAAIMNLKPQYIKVNVPADNGLNNFTLLLYKVNISPNGFTLLTSDGAKHPDDNSIVHYRGSIENDEQSIVSLSFTSSGIMGMVSNAAGNYVIGKIENNHENLYMIYNDKDLVPSFNFDCATNTSVPKGYNQRNEPLQTLSTNCVNWYWETDYDIYVGKGSSVTNVHNYIQGIFNQVATLYDNDGMNITLLTEFIWSTVDPYTGPSTSNYLSQFGSYRTSFNGDLANLLGYAGGGGVAWVDGFCSSTSHRMGYCGISSSFNTVPTYSWTVEVVAHEEGHLFGSPHTHSCAWNGNNTKIDACGDDAGYPSGSCPLTNPVLPPGGGTIMSYCHLTSVGINFNLGFGPQPAALMLDNEETSSCLSACSGCNPPSQPGTISGNTSVCQAASQTYSITSVSGATDYTWTLPSGWTGTSTTTSIVATAGSTGGNITVRANNSCGSSAVRTLAVTIASIPAQPGTITGGATVCENAAQTYSINGVSGATSYTWTLPSGWTGSSTTTSIVATAGGAGGNITVKANNSCGSSTVRTKAVTVSPLPAQPGTISGSASVCQSTSNTYSITAVNGATSYTWTLPSGWTGSSTTTSITAMAGSTGGNVTATANNSCGSSAVRTLAVAIVSIPSQPGTITGGATVCQNATQTYSITAVNGATSYSWTLPSGWTGTSTTTSIVATAGSTGGNVTVTANNSCGSSTVRTKAVTVTTVPAQPGTISGSASVCQSTSNTYSITAVNGATSYTWTLPAGWTGISTTTSITPTAGSNGGSITVKANNSCGSSSIRTMTVTVNTVPDSPDSIYRAGGRFKVCPGDARTYSVTSVSGETYSWTVPTGAVITSGQGTDIINVTYNSNFIVAGNITVTASNSCGASPVSSTLIQRKIPAVPASITGPVSVCNGSVTTYSIAAVPSATYYIWTVPAGASIQGSQTGTQISVHWGASGGNITVKAHNNCADSGPRSLAVNVTCREAGTSFDNEVKAELFPNPTSGILTVKFFATDELPYAIIVRDLTGRVLKNEKHKTVPGDNMNILDLSGFSKGIYFVRIESAEMSQLLKVSVE